MFAHANSNQMIEQRMRATAHEFSIIQYVNQYTTTCMGLPVNMKYVWIFMSSFVHGCMGIQILAAYAIIFRH